MIKDLISSLLPTKTQVIIRRHQQPQPEAAFMDVDRLHSILAEAEQGQCRRLFGLYRDILATHSHTQAEFGKRKLAVIGDEIRLVPVNDKDPAEKALITAVQDHLTSRDNWLQLLSHLLDATLYPVSVVERTYQLSSRTGWRFELGNLTPIPHHWLNWPDGSLALTLPDNLGNLAAIPTPLDSTRHFTHRGHLLSSVPDWWGGPMRAVLFWWLFATMDRDWWARFLDRFGSPFLEGRYPDNDESARFSLQNAFSSATRLFGIVVSREAEVKMHQANANSGDAFEKFHATANREISKIVVGQTLSAEGQNLGLGGGQASLQGDVRDDIQRFDSRGLSHVIRNSILAPLWRLNGWTTPLPAIAWGDEVTEEAEVNGALVASLAQAGITVTQAGLEILSQRVGFPLERAAQPIAFSAALSSTKEPEEITLIPAVARREERQRQARRATDELIAAASPQFAHHLKSHATKIEEAILDSSSPDEALDKVARLTASFDPQDAATVLNHTLSSCAHNALATAED